MKRELAKNLSMFQGIEIDYVNKLVDPAPDMTEDELQEVLKAIFSVNPDTGLPESDVSYWLSKDANPQVKMWLESNLLQPRGPMELNPKGLDDDLIVEMSRSDGESVKHYQDRLSTYFKDAQANVERLRKEMSING